MGRTPDIKAIFGPLTNDERYHLFLWYVRQWRAAGMHLRDLKLPKRRYDRRRRRGRSR